MFDTSRIAQSVRYLSDQLDKAADPTMRIAWYVVPLLVLLALGATVALGAMVYCMARGKHLAVTVNQGGGRYLIGCE